MRPLNVLLLVGFLGALSGLCEAQVERVSVTSAGKTGPGSSHEPSLSADGRYVAFSSTARLTPDDRNSRADVYVRDRVDGTTRRVTDDRGGDQPAISANGRFVTFRALDGLTRVRVVDLERPGIAIAAAIPSDITNYNRPSDSAVISPDGRYVGYAFRPTPELVAPDAVTRGHQVMLTDLLKQEGPRLVPEFGALESTIADLGRIVISYDGELVVFESKARLSSDDLNDGPDIYLTRRSQPGSIQRISRPAAGLPDDGTSHDPVIAQDGSRIFFISDQQLTSADDDERETIYFAASAGGFTTLTPLITNLPPVELSSQATVSGRFVAYLGKRSRMLPRAGVRTVDIDSETAVPMGGLHPLSAPVLNGDDSLIAFSARSGGQDQVFVASVPDAVARVAPSVVMNSYPPAADNTVVSVEGDTFYLGASVTSPDGGAIRLLKIELEGKEQLRTTNTTDFYSQVGGRGIYRARARAFNDAWVEGVSEPLRVIVRPSANRLAITGAEDLVQSLPLADGRVDFSGSLLIHNTRSTASGPLRVILTEAPTPAIMADGAASFSDVPPEEENVLDVIELPPLAGGSDTLVPMASHTSPADALGDRFKGRGWTVLANLREQIGSTWSSAENPPRPAMVFQTMPRLDENTNLPNGGVPLLGDPGSDPSFNPALLLSLLVQGRPRVGAPSAAPYAARAIFNNANRACLPAWSLVNAGGTARISDDGVLFVGSIAAPRNITIRATFADKVGDLPVTIFPLPPRLLVRASTPYIEEGGAGGEFRITRSGNTSQALTVSYAMEGSAINGSDYASLSGTATFAAGEGTLIIPLVPMQDAEVEGTETAVLRLLPDSLYRLGGARTARITLQDDEPLPAGQPDLTLRRSPRAPIGAFTYQGSGGYDEDKQVMLINGVRNGKVNVVAGIVNRGTSAQSFHFQGSPGTVGFSIRYSSAGADVTADVVAGTFLSPTVDVGGQTSVTVIIVPTADAPVGGRAECDLLAFSDLGGSDLGTIVVTRAR